MLSSVPICVGLDIGSVALKVVLATPAGQIVEQAYLRTHGRPIETALDALPALLDRHPGAIELVAATGSGGRIISELLHIPCVNEVISQASAIRALRPDVRTLIEMGGQDSKIIYLPEAHDPRPMLDFAMNTNCAAGTGSFLDQQATRLGVKIEEVRHDPPPTARHRPP